VQRRRARASVVGILAVVCVLAASGCGGSHAASTTSPPTTPATTTQNQSTQRLIDALQPPKATVLEPGASVTISKAVLQAKGWQVACVAKGHRVTAEAVRGQRTGDLRKNQKGAREIIGPPKAGSPSIWVAHIAAGAIVVSCR
jgi:hypothetical protein